MPSAPRRLFPPATEIAAIAVTFFIGAALSLMIARGGERVAALWLPNAVMFIWLLRRPELARIDTFALAWAGNTAAGLVFGDAPMTAGLLALSNSIEVALALILARRAGLRIEAMGSIDQQIRLILCCGAIAPMASATVAAAVLSEGSIARATTVWLSWIVTDALGMMLIASTLGIILQHLAHRVAVTRAAVTEWSVLTLAGTALTVAVFSQNHMPLLFLVTPVVIMHALRHGVLGTAVSTLKIAVIAVATTVLGGGPIMLTQDPWLRLVILQLFLVTIFLMGIPIAALLRREQETARSLVRRNAQFSMLAASMSDAVLAFDARGRCTFSAGSAHQLLAMPTPRIVGSYAADLVEPSDRQRFEDALDRILRRESQCETVTYRSSRPCGNGQDTFLEAKLAPTIDDSPSRDLVIIATLRDVTERVSLERDLVEARERAESAVLAKSQFLANMSHEIRTPMNGVLGFAELLEQRLDDPEQRRQARMIVQSGQSMMQLLNDILDLSKVEVGLVTISDDIVNLRSLMDDCVSLNAAQAANKSVALTLAMAPGLPELILCDPLRVRQILLNLLGNAIKFTDRGSVSISVAALGNRLRILVRDTGIGIPSERLQAIFQPFEQADNATSRRYGGTGLGLAISRQLAELMDGRLDVSSTLDQGSCFALEIPLRAVDASTPAKCADFPFSEPSIISRRGRILLVDDQEINRELAGAMLHQLGQAVVSAENGERAIAAVEDASRSGAPFDLVLMDIQMPVCDGYQAARELRRLGFASGHLPIVAMTANAYPEDVRMALDNGMQDHLSKPITLARLDALLARWIGSDQPVAANMAVLPESHIAQLWLSTRNAALEAARHWLRDAASGTGSRDELQAAMHRIAGTALHFGEGPFGEAASRVDRAIAEGVDDEELRMNVGRVMAIATDSRLVAASDALRKIA